MSATSKPEGYPLPWCSACDAPYWQVNFLLTSINREWREWQGGKSMSEIIPEINKVVYLAAITGEGPAK